jgi:hypothetical protein
MLLDNSMGRPQPEQSYDIIGLFKYLTVIGAPPQGGGKESLETCWEL